MKGLLLKDLYSLKQQGLIMAVLYVVWLILTIKDHDASLLGVVTAMLAAILPINALAYDERANWDKYALTMPVSRRDMVICKYLLVSILLVVGNIVVFIFNLVFTQSIGESLVKTGLYFAIGLILPSITMPVIIKFGTEKVRLISIVVAVLPAAGMGAFAQIVNSDGGIEIPDTLIKLLPLAPVAGIVICLISYGIAVKLYESREL